MCIFQGTDSDPFLKSNPSTVIRVFTVIRLASYVFYILIPSIFPSAISLSIFANSLRFLVNFLQRWDFSNTSFIKIQAPGFGQEIEVIHLDISYVSIFVHGRLSMAYALGCHFAYTCYGGFVAQLVLRPAHRNDPRTVAVSSSPANVVLLSGRRWEGSTAIFG